MSLSNTLINPGPKKGVGMKEIADVKKIQQVGKNSMTGNFWIDGTNEYSSVENNQCN